MLKTTCLWLMLLAVMFAGIEAGYADGADDAFMDALLDDTEIVTVEGVEILGLLPEDEKQVRRQVGIKAGDDLFAHTVEQGLAKIRDAGVFVVRAPAEKPAFNGQMRLSYRCYYRRPPLFMSFGVAGALDVRLGARVLLNGALPVAERVLLETEEGVSASPATPEMHFDASAHRHAQLFSWGEVAVQFVPGSNRLDVVINVINRSDTDLLGVRVKPFGEQGMDKRFKFLGKTVRFDANNVPDWPQAATRDLGDGTVALGLDGNWSDCSASLPRGVCTVELPPVPAGGSHSVRLSLRFGAGRAGGGSPFALAAEHYRRYGELYPFEGPHWDDRRPIGAIHASSVEYGFHLAKNEKNPRGWNIGVPDIDITTEAGLATFHEGMMAFARSSARECTSMNAQGIIAWSLGGQQFPHNISYIGSPDKLAQNAPEMDAIADDWFKVFSDAGLRTGVCLRPNNLWTPPDSPNWRIQLFLWKNKEKRIPDHEAIVDLLDAKITYAKQRWGCTLYYVDSNTYNWPKLLDWTIFRDLGKRHPDCLIIPEHETLHYWRVTAPLAITPAHVRAIWPEAFSVPLMQHVDKCNDKTIAYFARVAKAGDPLMIDGWYHSARNAVVKGAYEKGFVEKWHRGGGVNPEE